MIETLYQTRTPEKGKSECYVLVLTSRAASGGKIYAFMEEHGQWNHDLQRFLYKINFISTDEQLTYPHAHGMYESAKRNLARQGFVHSFTPGGMPLAPDGQRNESSPDRISQSETAMP